MLEGWGACAHFAPVAPILLLLHPFHQQAKLANTQMINIMDYQ